MNEIDNTPICNDPECKLPNCAKAYNLHDEKVADMEQLVAEVAQLKRQLEWAQNTVTNMTQERKNFETAIREAYDENADEVSWEYLERALDYLGIDLSSSWKACITVTFSVFVTARSEDSAREKIDSLYHSAFSVNDRDVDDYDVEDIDWSNIERVE